MNIRIKTRKSLRAITTRIVPKLVIIALLWTLVILVLGRPSPEVWLPRDSSRMINTGDFGISSFSLIDHSKSTINWHYGRGTLFKTTDNSGTIYEARSNSLLLNPSRCPNVFHETEHIDPSGCSKVGSVHGVDVYTIDRSLPMGTTDVYAVLGNTFVASQDGYDSSDPDNLTYIASFVHYTRQQAAQLLARNKAESAAAAIKTNAAKSQEHQAEAAAYKDLAFTPLLPSSLPTGWAAFKPTVEGSSPPPKALFVGAGYSKNFNKNNEQDVGLYVVKLSDFQVGTSCGPTIGAGAALLPCQPVPGTDYYEAWDSGATSPNGSDYINHYLYVPIGDALAQVSTGNCCSTNARSAISPEALQAQQAIAEALRPVPKDAFKNARFDPLGNMLLE